MDSTIRIVSVLIILLALCLLAGGLIVAREYKKRRRQSFPLRPIAAYAAVPLLVGQSIESSRPLHLSSGSAGLGGSSTLLAVAAAELFYQMAQRAVIGDVSPVITTSDATALPLAQDTLRRAYQVRGREDRFQYGSVRWYPAGRRSLAFAAALTATMGDDSAASNVLVGSFGPELALVMDSAARRRLPTIASSDQLEGQAIAFALTDTPLIGEEMFVAGAYLGEEGGSMALALALDALRWIVVLAMLVGVILSLLSSR